MTPPAPPSPRGLADWPPEDREAFLLGLHLADADLEDEDADVLIRCLETERSDPTRSRIVSLIGSHIDAGEVRAALDEIPSEAAREPATRDALLELAVSARFDDIPEVRAGGRSRLDRLTAVDAEDPVQLGKFLVDIFRDETHGPGLRKAAARGLAWLGEPKWLEALLDFGEALVSGSPAPPETAPEGNASENSAWTLESVADALGEAPRELSEAGWLPRADRLLYRMEETPGVNKRILSEARKRIGRETRKTAGIDPIGKVPETPPAPTTKPKEPKRAASEFAETLRGWFRSPFILGTAVAAGVAAVLLPWIFQADAPEFRELALTGVTREGYVLQIGPTVRTRSRAPDEMVLRSGEHVSLSFMPETDGYIVVILLDSRRNARVLFSEKVSAGREIRLPESREEFPLGYPLDDHTGVETLVVLASGTRIPEKRLSRGLENLRREGPDAAGKSFPKATVEILPFRHE